MLAALQLERARIHTGMGDYELGLQALDTLKDFATSLSSDLAVAEIRQTFNTGVRDLLQEGSDNLVLADLNQESATLLSLQTRQSLTTASLSILGNAESSILRLFSS